MRQDVIVPSLTRDRVTAVESESARSAGLPANVRLAMNEITTYRWAFEEDVVQYAAAGFSGIGIWRPKLSEFGEERGVDLVLETGLAVSSLSYVGGFTGASGQSFAESLEDARDAIRLAAALRAESLIVVSGPRALHTARHARRLFVDGLKRLGDLAGPRGLTLAVLPMHSMYSRSWTFLTTIDDTLEMLDQCDHSHVRMAFDAYHLWQEPQLLERIPALAPLTSLVRLSDWRDPPRSDHDRCLPGDGCIPLTQILRAFDESGYSGSYEIEIWSEELWASDYQDLLADCRARFDSLWSSRPAARKPSLAAPAH